MEENSGKLRVRRYTEESNRAEEYSNWNENTLEGLNSRLGDTEEQISKLKDRVIEITEPEQKKRNKKRLGYFKRSLEHHQAQ